MTNEQEPVDDLDRRILELFSAEPKVGVLAASRRLRVARGTVQARLDRLERIGVVTGWGPNLDPSALGYPVTAFVTLEIQQHGGRSELARRLADIPEVLECWTITGSGDLWCRVVARSHADLQRALDLVVHDPGVERTVTVIGLTEQIGYRTSLLVRASGQVRAEERGG